MESSSRRFIGARNIFLCITDALQPVEKLNDETASEACSAFRDAVDATRFLNAVLSSSDEHEVLICFETDVAHTRSHTQDASVGGRDFYSYAILLRQELRSVHSTACEKLLPRLDDIMLTEISPTITSLLPVRSSYLSTVRLSFTNGLKKRL